MASLQTLSMIKLVLVLGFLAAAVLAKEGYVNVQGTLLCNGQPVTEDIKVKIKEKDPLNNDVLSTVAPDARGRFKAEAHQNEWFGIQPYVYVYHKCGLQQKSGFFARIAQRFGACSWLRRKQAVPSDYVSDSPASVRTYDLGIVELKNDFNGADKVSCINN